MLDLNEIDDAIAILEHTESSYPNMAKLADLYAVRDRLTGVGASTLASGGENVFQDSRSTGSRQNGSVGDFGESEFLSAIEGKDEAAIWSIMDELMETLSVVNTRVYQGVLRKIYNT